MILFKSDINLIRGMVSGVPDSHLPFRNETIWWIGHDNETNFNENHDCQKYGHFTYTINSKGYRCCELDQVADFKIVSLGCSIAFGYGLPKELVYHEIITERIREHLGCSVVNFNLGMPSGSNQFIARMASVVSETLKPNLLLVNYTYPHRREYVDKDGRYHTYFSTGQKDVDSHPMCNFKNLTSSCDDLVNAYMHMNHVKHMAESKGIKYAWSTIDKALHKAGFDNEHYCGVFEIFDYARDGLHPGKLSNQMMAEKYWAKIKDEL